MAAPLAHNGTLGATAGLRTTRKIDGEATVLITLQGTAGRTMTGVGTEAEIGATDIGLANHVSRRSGHCVLLEKQNVRNNIKSTLGTK
eukprot:SAG31_NODE_2840_length_5016_cov_15.783608_6_plen_88_part_00